MSLLLRRRLVLCISCCKRDGFASRAHGYVNRNWLCVYMLAGFLFVAGGMACIGVPRVALGGGGGRKGW